jgi:hypothetical protein
MTNAWDRLMEQSTLEDDAAPTQAPLERFARLQAEVTTSETYKETCPKCRGTGRFRSYGACYTCKGVGHREYKTSPQTRQANRDRAHARHAAKIEGFARTYPNEVAWMNAKQATFGFAGKMLQALMQYGELTERQLETVQRLMTQDAERAAARKVEAETRAAAASTVSVEALETAYATARENGIRFPKLPLTWQNPEDKDDAQTFLFKTSQKGPIYVTESGEYLGKITEGKFFGVRACSKQTEERIVAICADPKQAAIAYGRRFGVCCKCGRELTNKASIELGIGPICAAKYGWA